MKKNAQLNKYGAILLLSDLWCAYDWGDANVSYDQVLKNEWALSPQTNINNIVVDVKQKMERLADEHYSSMMQIGRCI